MQLCESKLGPMCIAAGICMLLPIHSALLLSQTRPSLPLIDEHPGNGTSLHIVGIRQGFIASCNCACCIPLATQYVQSYGTAMMLGLAAEQLCLMLPVTHSPRFNSEPIRLGNATRKNGSHG